MNKPAHCFCCSYYSLQHWLHQHCTQTLHRRRCCTTCRSLIRSLAHPLDSLTLHGLNGVHNIVSILGASSHFAENLQQEFLGSTLLLAALHIVCYLLICGTISKLCFCQHDCFVVLCCSSTRTQRLQHTSKHPGAAVITSHIAQQHKTMSCRSTPFLRATA